MRDKSMNVWILPEDKKPPPPGSPLQTSWAAELGSAEERKCDVRTLEYSIYSTNSRSPSDTKSLLLRK